MILSTPTPILVIKLSRHRPPTQLLFLHLEMMVVYWLRVYFWPQHPPNFLGNQEYSGSKPYLCSSCPRFSTELVNVIAKAL